MTNSRLWAGALLGLAATATAVVLVVGSAAADDRGGYAVNGSAGAGMSDAELAALARKTAGDNGEDAPEAVALRTTSRAALAVTDPAVTTADDDVPVDLVVMEGDFVARYAKLMQGAPLPTGTVLTMTVDPRTGDMLGYSVGRRVPNLSTLGRPVALDTDG
jgi:hypothetical protein